MVIENTATASIVNFYRGSANGTWKKLYRGPVLRYCRNTALLPRYKKDHGRPTPLLSVTRLSCCQVNQSHSSIVSKCRD